MNDYNTPPAGQGSDVKVPILIGAVVALLGANIAGGLIFGVGMLLLGF